MSSFLNLIAFLNLNASGFQIGMKRAESATKAFSNQIKGEFAKAFGYGAIIAYSKKIIDFADNITDLSDRLGVSTKALQEWGYAAKKNGSSLDEVVRFFEALAVAREKALGGDQGSINSFARLGVSEAALAGSRIEDIGKIIGDTVKKGDQQQFTAALKEVGGRGATELVAAFKSGLGDLFTDAPIISPEVLVQLKMMKTEAQAFADVFAGPVAKAVVWVGKRINDIVDAVRVIVGGIAAYIGTAFGGGSIEDARKAMGQVGDQVLKDRAEREKKIAADAEAFATKGSPDVDKFGNPWGQNKLVSFLPKKAQSINEIQSSALTSWQQLGAAVRGNPDSQTFRSIEKNTQQTVEKLEALKKVSPGGFGAAQAPAIF